MIHSRHYPGKILLFGEYSLFLGSKGIVLPYFSKIGSWQCRAKVLEEVELHNFYKASLEFKTNSRFDWERFKNDLLKGWYFQSTIPSGEGLGSSGALVAAFYDRYGQNTPLYLSDNIDLNLVRGDLAVLESYHHHQSSGIDPLVSWLQRPLLLNGLSKIQLLSDLDAEFEWLKKNNFMIYLISTNHSRSTSKWVSRFRELSSDGEWMNWFESEYVKLVDVVVEALLNKNSIFFYKIFDLCQQQSLMMHEFRDLSLLKKIESFAAKDERIQTKLCGAGGGGHYLVFTHGLSSERDEKLRQEFTLQPLI